MASVKPHDPTLPTPPPEQNLRDYAGVGGRFVLRDVRLTTLLTRAFGLPRSRISGPNWLDSQTFDIVAKAPAGVSRQQYPLMFQALLADRFQLRYHIESPMTSVYALLVTPEGSKLKPGLADSDAENYGPISDTQSGTTGRRSIRAADLGVYHVTSANGILHYEYDNMTLKALVGLIGQDGGMLDLPVVDMTGLEGSYQIALDVASAQVRCGSAAPMPDADEATPAASEPCGDAVRASLGKQGLRLERRKAPLGKIVIDHIEKTPTEN